MCTTEFLAFTERYEDFKKLGVVKALQFNWDKKLATPANWKLGEAGIAAAPLNLEDSFQRDKEGAERWYLKRVKAQGLRVQRLPTLLGNQT